MLGTNGGGFFNANSAHPFENPTTLTSTGAVDPTRRLDPARALALVARDTQGRALGFLGDPVVDVLRANLDLARLGSAREGDTLDAVSTSRPRGRLRVYLGAAPGVGKTYAMLGEGHRRLERGTDVVVGFVESHGRPLTAALVAGLPVVPRRELTYRGSTFTEMDLDAVLARAPRVALVDELAHTNVPGSRHPKRWQDVEELLAAGIDVVTTVNIQHLESLNDVVERITGVPQRETVPDHVVRSADQVELVDMSPEALRRRLAHGNVYAPEKVDAALSNYFRVGNLTALRELALLWLADEVDTGLQRYRAEHHIVEPWEARERIVVALAGGPEGDTLIRRASRIAARAAGADLLAVHVSRSDGLSGADPAALAGQRRLVESLGGSYHQVIGDDIPQALLEFARAENATQLILGVSARSRLAALFGGPGIGASVTRLSGPIDVHIVTHEAAGRNRPSWGHHPALTRQRRLAGLATAAVLLPMLTVLLASGRQHLNLASELLLFQLAVVVVAIIGGLWPALLAAVAAGLLANYYFAPPLYTLTISESNNVLAIAVFLLVAVLVSVVVELAGRRSLEAARSSAESRLLVTVAGSVLRGQAALPTLLGQVREAFALASVALLERDDAAPDGWRPVAVSGGPPAGRPDLADNEVPADEGLVLVLDGRPLAAHDRRVLGAVAAQAATAFEQQRLAAEAAAARPLAEVDRMRTALLAAVSHDLRTPLASAKAAVTSLRSQDVAWTEEERAELLATAEESLDRLSALVADLLDMSRLQAGALSVFPRRIALDEVVPLALDALGPVGRGVVVDVPETLPEVSADPTLLERIIVNLVANALRYSPPGRPPRITASALGERVELRVVDRGPGIAVADRERVFAPFQRLGDTDNTSGVGLGLALSRGLAEAMSGTVEPEDTPGGGLTMVVALPAAAPLAPAPPVLSVPSGPAVTGGTGAGAADRDAP